MVMATPTIATNAQRATPRIPFGIFSKSKEPVATKPKAVRSSFFQNLRSKGRGKENEIESDEIVQGAGNSVGETSLISDRDSEAPVVNRKASGGNLEHLIDSEQHERTGRRPLFGADIKTEVPDVQGSSSEGDALDPKGKGKAPVYLIGGASSTSLSNAAETHPEILEGLPKAYQIISGKDAKKCPNYNYASLYNGRPVRELWFPRGDTLIYLCSKNSSTPRGPSFLVFSEDLESTSEYWVVAFSPVWQSGFEIDKDAYPQAKYALFFAPDRPDGKNEETDPLALLRHYVTMRNVFACICDSYCVGLIEDDSPLLSDLIDRMLMYFDGEADNLASKLSEFIVRSGLWDVSNDPLKAVDLLNLASTYQIEPLYNEAFVHCVGMWPQITAANAHDVLSDPIIDLLDARHAEIDQKLRILSTNLKGFHFKELWATKSPTSRLPMGVRRGYEHMRNFLKNYYIYSNTGFSKWPPKNLNTRPVLLKVYADFCALYRLLVDKQYTTARACQCYHSLFHYVRALNLIDTSIAKHGKSMPYGIPNLPGYVNSELTIFSTSVQHREEEFVPGTDMSQRVNEKILETMLPRLYNNPGTHTMEHEGWSEEITSAFMGFEKHLMKGKALGAIVEMRLGIWLLIYGVLSAMAELTVETGAEFKDEVEYLLCCDTRGIFEWEGKRVRTAATEEEEAEAEAEDVDRWSIASLEGTSGNANGNTEERTVLGKTVKKKAAKAVTFEDLGKEGAWAEMSYPWSFAHDLRNNAAIANASTTN
ncbi:hypothetical protein TWF694_006390 [Orbilia ellipsospora]|uniref:DUF8004 domain-containing protein n=1 Tax=Orbilia ellipsospora TaxID=2528407 RepID=A0AAV9XKC0_9PEZI